MALVDKVRSEDPVQSEWTPSGVPEDDLVAHRVDAKQMILQEIQREVYFLYRGSSISGCTWTAISGCISTHISGRTIFVLPNWTHISGRTIFISGCTFFL